MPADARFGGVVVQRLTGAHAPEVARHLLRLDEPDRRLRFGAPIRDATIEAYVRRIDLSRDRVFGIFAGDLELLGVAHLALEPSGQTAELGLSVDRAARGKGCGYGLLKRAVLHATNLGYRALFMHCLAENHILLHLARKAGLVLVVEAGEADGRLELAERTKAGAVQETIEDQFALVDTLLKQQYAWLGRAQGLPAPRAHEPSLCDDLQ